METNVQQQPNKDTMSGGAVLEMILSLFVLITLFIPVCSWELGFSITGLSGGDVVGETRLISFYNMYEERDWLYYTVFALPVVNFIAKIFRRTSWLSALTLYSAAMPIMLANEFASDPAGFFVSQPLWGYYWAWFNVYGIAISVFISWLIFFGKKFRFYKLLFIVFGIFFALGLLVVYLYDRAFYLTEEEL